MNNSTQIKNPVGRPCKPPAEQVSEIITIRLTPGEKASLTASAAESGLSTTELIRRELAHIL
jgi:predicted HicB family RNase H-like nuclease